MTDKRILPDWLNYDKRGGRCPGSSASANLRRRRGCLCGKRDRHWKIPGFGSLTAAAVKSPEVLLQAEKELTFIEKNQISCYFLTDESYPKRLKECSDAPVLLYFKGKTDLNSTHIVSIVGTRHITEYGRTMTEELIHALSISYPDLLVVSGLAYGVDICAHRSALKYGLPTVAVLAHGLNASILPHIAP